MATPDPLYFMCPSLQDYFVDKDNGAPLSAGIVTFYRDESRLVKKSVYQQERVPPVTGAYKFTALPNPMVLSSVGTFVDTNGADIIPYFYPWVNAPTDPASDPGAQDLYYITVESSGNINQFNREAWPPGASDNPSTTDNFSDTDNILSNPQFVEVNFTGSTSISVSGIGTYTEIAPDWTIETSGSGTVVVDQIAITNDPVPSNPPYVLDITVPNLSAPLLLRQRLYNSPRLLTRNFMSGYFVVQSQDGLQHNISLNYRPYGLGPTVICQQNIPSSGYVSVAGTIQATNFSLVAASTAWMDILISIPINSHIRISSAQVVGVENITSSTPFIQQSTARQQDHLYHYWEPRLKLMRIPSHLTAWDFLLNPQQWGGIIGPIAVGGPNTAFYAWDQTIIHQTVDASVAVSLNTGGELTLTPNQPTQIGILQYLTGYKCKDILRNALYDGLSTAIKISSNLNINVNVSLWYTKNVNLPVLASGGSNLVAKGSSFVSTMLANGHPGTVVAGWIEIPFVVPHNQTKLVSSDLIQRQIDYIFWKYPTLTLTEISLSTYFAIFVGTSQLLNGTVIYVDAISLVPGEIPTLPAPQSQDQVLRESQYYWETSYASKTGYGVINQPNPVVLDQDSSFGAPYPVTYGYLTPSYGAVPYQQVKVKPPIVKTYSNFTGVYNDVTAVLDSYNTIGGHTFSALDVILLDYYYIYYNSIRGFNIAPIGAAPFPYVFPVDVTAANTILRTNAALIFHYYSDARLGVV